MSEFSDTCRDFINKSNTNIYQIAKSTGLDRTTLNKMVQGKRLPSRAFVEKFADVLTVNNEEREELLQLFKMEKIGKEIYFCRQEVENLICNFQNLRHSFENTTYRRRMLIDRAGPKAGEKGEVTRLLTEVDILDAVQYVVSAACEAEPEPVIYMDAFPGQHCAMQQMIQEEKYRNRKITCCQFVNIYYRSGHQQGLQRNVKMLHTALSFAFAFRGNYEVRYFYKTMDEENPCEIWPHYLVTKSHVLLLSQDGRQGVLLENDQISREYLLRMCEKRKNSRNLFVFAGTEEDVLNNYQTYVVGKNLTLSFDSSLCTANLIDPDMLLEGESTSLVQEYAALCRTAYEESYFDKEYVRISSLGGLEEFAHTGRLPGVFGQFTEPFSPEKRAEALRRYGRSLEQRRNEYFLKEEISVPVCGLNFELYEPNRVFIYSAEEGLPFGCAYMEEPGIYVVLKDYFDSLLEDGRVYSIEESIRLFRNRVEKLLA